MKKISITFLLALTIISVANLASPPEASAKRIDEDGATWWSVPELLEYKKQADQEMDRQCGDDESCRQELYFSKIESEDKEFRALEMLTEQQFVLTGVNFGKNAIKILFFDEDMMLSRMGIREHLELESLYIGWFDYDPERIYNFGATADELLSGSAPGAHKVYTWTNNSGATRRVLNNEETELVIKTANLTSNTSNEFDYSIFAGQFNAQGRLQYGSCFNDPDYKDGEECHLMISPEKGTAFFASQEKIVAINNNTTNETAASIEEPSPKNSEHESQNNQEDGSDDSFSQDSQITPSKQNEQPQTEPTAQSLGSSEIKTPETGAAYDGEENHASDLSQTFPYITLSTAIMILSAIFLAKKYKKGVDNATGV